MYDFRQLSYHALACRRRSRFRITRFACSQTRALLAPALALRPALGAEQRHEPDLAEVLLDDLVVVAPGDPDQALVLDAAVRQHQAAADGELGQQRRRRARRTGRDGDRLV